MHTNKDMLTDSLDLHVLEFDVTIQSFRLFTPNNPTHNFKQLTNPRIIFSSKRKMKRTSRILISVSSILTLFTFIISTTAGPVAYGICQSGCAKVIMACYVCGWRCCFMNLLSSPLLFSSISHPAKHSRGFLTIKAIWREG